MPSKPASALQLFFFSPPRLYNPAGRPAPGTGTMSLVSGCVNLPNTLFLFHSLLLVGLCVTLFVAVDTIQYLAARISLSRIDNPPPVVNLPQSWLWGPIDLFNRHHTYLYNLSRKFPGSWLRFSLGRKEVSVLLGREGRHAFYSTKGFSFAGGYSLFHPGIAYVAPQPATAAWFLHLFMRTEVLDRLLPEIFSDIDRELRKLEDGGCLDLITDVQKLVLRVNFRVILGDAVADDAEKLASACRAYTLTTSDEGGWALLWPFLPTKARISRAMGALSLWRLISDEYANCTQHKSDACIPHILQAEDIDSTEAVKCLFVTIFAGQGNTSSVLRWFLILLCEHPTWQERIRKEVDAFVAAHTSSNISTVETLSTLPFLEWEQSLPTLDLCFRETLRLTFNGINSRQNLGPDVEIGGRVIRHGEHAMYMTADAHFDPELYPDPKAFDPDRHRGKLTDKSFLAWGAGHHPCAGQRLARMVVKITTALFLYSFNLSLEGPHGEGLDKIPYPEIGFTDIGKPPSGVVLRYRKNMKAA